MITGDSAVPFVIPTPQIALPIRVCFYHLLTHIFPNLSQTMIICAFTDPQACTPCIHRYPLLLPLLYLSLPLGQLHLSLYRYDSPDENITPLQAI